MSIKNLFSKCPSSVPVRVPAPVHHGQPAAAQQPGGERLRERRPDIRQRHGAATAPLTRRNRVQPSTKT